MTPSPSTLPKVNPNARRNRPGWASPHPRDPPHSSLPTISPSRSLLWPGRRDSPPRKLARAGLPPATSAPDAAAQAEPSKILPMLKRTRAYNNMSPDPQRPASTEQAPGTYMPVMQPSPRRPPTHTGASPPGSWPIISTRLSLSRRRSASRMCSPAASSIASLSGTIRLTSRTRVEPRPAASSQDAAKNRILVIVAHAATAPPPSRCATRPPYFR